MLKINKIGIIGCGNMGKHMLKLIKKNIQNNNYLNGLGSACKIVVSTASSMNSKNISEQYGVSYSISNGLLAKSADLIFLMVKPNHIPGVCNEIKNFITNDTIIISSAAGISLNNYTKWLHPEQIVVRCMPNILISGKHGIITYAANSNVSKLHKNAITNLTVGPKHIWFDNEDYIDMSTAISGSGPAFMSKIIKYYVESATNIGLPKLDAEELVYSSFNGTLEMLEHQTDRQISIQVASKGGATEQGLKKLENSNIYNSIYETIKSTYLKVNRIRDNF